jgi:hypothetical protein
MKEPFKLTQPSLRKWYLGIIVAREYQRSPSHRGGRENIPTEPSNPIPVPTKAFSSDRSIKFSHSRSSETTFIKKIGQRLVLATG